MKRRGKHKELNKIEMLITHHIVRTFITLQWKNS